MPKGIFSRPANRTMKNLRTKSGGGLNDEGREDAGFKSWQKSSRRKKYAGDSGSVNAKPYNSLRYQAHAAVEGRTRERITDEGVAAAKKRLEQKKRAAAKRKAASKPKPKPKASPKKGKK